MFEIGIGRRRLGAWFAGALSASFLGLALACTDAESGGGCALDDADGIIGGSYRFELTVDDTEFSPKILKTQNSAKVSLTLANHGGTPHDFSIDCLPTPNDDGCPQQSCFEESARISALDPGAAASATFVVPRAEGIYTFRSTLAGDSQTGQFIVQ